MRTISIIEYINDKDDKIVINYNILLFKDNISSDFYVKIHKFLNKELHDSSVRKIKYNIKNDNLFFYGS